MDVGSSKTQSAMTEEDTFNALRRPNLQQMMNLWDTLVAGADSMAIVNGTWATMRSDFFNSHNWDWDDFFVKRRDYLMKKHGF